MQNFETTLFDTLQIKKERNKILQNFCLRHFMIV